MNYGDTEISLIIDIHNWIMDLHDYTTFHVGHGTIFVMTYFTFLWITCKFDFPVEFQW